MDNYIEKQLMNNKHYYYELDILRGLACLLVFCSHLPIYKLMGASDFLYTVGCAGVYVFFVISGFIIYKTFGYQIEKKDCHSFDDWTQAIKQNLTYIYSFWHRRFLRLFPALFFLFFCLGIVTVHYGITHSSLGESLSRYFRLIGNFLLLDNSMNKPYDTIDKFLYWKVGVIWSLDCEIFFYLIFPLVIVIKKFIRYLPITLISIFIIKSILYSFVEFKYMYYSLLANLDFFILGILIAHYHDKISVNKKVLLLLTIVSAYTLIIAPHKVTLYRFYLNGLISSAVLVYVASIGKNLLNIKFLKIGSFLHFVGIRSYFIYLTHVLTKYMLSISIGPYLHTYLSHHFNIYVKLTERPELHDQISNFAVLLVVLLLSDLFYRFVEKPFVKKRKNLYSLNETQNA